jgi:hypothetical protein
MATWAQFEREADDLAAMVRARFEAAETHILATLRGFHAFRLELHEAVTTTVEADELVVRLWQPGHGVRTIRRK